MSISPIAESEQELTVSDKQFNELTQRVNALSIAVGEMRGSLSAWGKIGTILASAALAAGLGALGWSWTISTTVAKIQQAINDGGTAKIVSELKSPKSQEQLRASLSTVIAQVQTAKAEKKEPDTSKVSALSDAVDSVVKRNPTLPEAWQAAAQLVSFRSSQPTTEITKKCFEWPHDPKPQTNVKPGDGHHVAFEVWDSNCTLDFRNPEDMERTVERNMRLHSADFPNLDYILVRLDNAHVIYGGEDLKMVRFLFVNCTFEVELPKVPPPNGRKLTEQLLEAKDIRNVEISGL
jgi:hypothetical protein